MKRAATCETVVPQFTSDRMLLLGPLVTPRALEIARARVLNDAPRVSDLDDDDSTLRIALLLVREMNPSAHFTNEEEGILRGMDRKTVGKRFRAGELS
jgi:hypothetical protein